MVDNSQGHGIYISNALLTQDMNYNPGGSQLTLQDGWYIDALGNKITQQMNFPSNHPKYPNKLKGMKLILTKCGLLHP